MEPINVSDINTVSLELETTFQEEPSDALHAFSNSFLDNNICDICPCEDISADFALQNEQKQPSGFAAQSSLRALGSMLDDDTIDFLTHLKFES